jgi:hypothetical protein
MKSDSLQNERRPTPTATRYDRVLLPRLMDPVTSTSRNGSPADLLGVS